MRINIESDNFHIPSNHCCCCGTTANQSLWVGHYRSINNIPVERKGWYFPYCTACIEHHQPDNIARAILVLGCVGVILCLTRGEFFLGLAAACITALSCAVAGYIADSKRNPMCSSVDEAVKLIGWTGEMNMLVIKSDSYAKEFLLSNSGIARQVEE